METPVASLGDFGEKRMIPVKAGSLNLVLFKLDDGSVSALEDRCSHANVRLSRGSCEGSEVECPAHGARFDVASGKALCMPAVAPVRSFETTVREGQIYVNLPEEGA